MMCLRADDEEYYYCSEKQAFDDNRFDILVFIIMKDRCLPFAAMILGREVPFGWHNLYHGFTLPSVARVAMFFFRFCKSRLNSEVLPSKHDFQAALGSTILVEENKNFKMTLITWMWEFEMISIPTSVDCPRICCIQFGDTRWDAWFHGDDALHGWRHGWRWRHAGQYNAGRWQYNAGRWHGWNARRTCGNDITWGEDEGIYWTDPPPHPVTVAFF